MMKPDGRSLAGTNELKHAAMQPDHTGFEELDQIVLHIFNSLEGERTLKDDGNGAECGQRAVRTNAKAAATGQVALREAWPPASSEVHSQPEPLRNKTVRSSTQEQGDDVEAKESRPGTVDENPDLSLLARNEEEFVARTVAWLESHPNPDILLDRIWTLAVEARSAEQCGSVEESEADPEAPEGPEVSSEH